MSRGALVIGHSGVRPAPQRNHARPRLTVNGSAGHFWRRPGNVELRLCVVWSSGESRECVVYDWSGEPSPYEKAWHLQKALVEERCNNPDVADAAILVQHQPVFTLGAGSTLSNLKFDPSHPPLPIHRTERGGEVTYHGPGQLVLYPILNLRRHRRDLHWYLRALEGTAIDVLDQVSGLEGSRLDGLTGVWVDGSKVAAIGVRASRWVTYHGLSLNVTNDLSPYSSIVPCGIPDRPVTTVQAILEQDAWENDPLLEPQPIDGTQLLEEYKFGLIDAFFRAFDLSGIPAAEGDVKMADLLPRQW